MGTPRVVSGEILVTVPWPSCPQKNSKILTNIVDFSSYAKNRPSKKVMCMRPGPPYDTANGHPRPLSPRDFLAKKTEISIAPNGEPQKTRTESVLLRSTSTSKVKVKIKPGTQTWHSIPSFWFVPDFILSRSQRTITKTREDHKGPQKSITKECKEPLGTARGRKKRILNSVVILSKVTVIYRLAAVRKKLLLLSSSLFTRMTPGCRSVDCTTLNRATNVPCSGNA